MHLIESSTPFSRSKIWEFQRDFFEEKGIDAWKDDVIPHYLTCNPVVGKTYAEMVLALLRDLSFKGSIHDTVYLLELGAGHGRLCYHFFKHFEKFYSKNPFPLPRFCYVQSDFTESQIEFWKTHPSLQPYIEKGLLDFAQFDAEKDTDLLLQLSGTIISTDSLSQPLVVIANYFFDSIPQELYLVKDQTLSNVCVELSSKLDPKETSKAELIESFELSYQYQLITDSPYPKEPYLANLLNGYKKDLRSTHLLFPDTGLRCMERLKKWSTYGLVLLTADKGDHDLLHIDDEPAPELINHGSFSLTVNYHAFSNYCHAQGGIGLFPYHQPENLDIGCLLMIPEASSFLETLNAYERYVRDFGPDDFFSIKKFIEHGIHALSISEVLAVIRLSGYDARIFLQMYPRITALLPDIFEDDEWNIFQVIPRIWDTYFPLGEGTDLAFHIGELLKELGFHKAAIIYFEKSIQLYGRLPDQLQQMQLCHEHLGNTEEAALLLKEIEEATAQ